MEYLKPFLIGGSIIAASKFIANHASPEYAAIIGGMPIGILASFFILGNKLKGEYYKGLVINDVTIALVIIGLNVVLKMYPKLNVNIASVLSIIIWALVSFFSVKL